MKYWKTFALFAAALLSAGNLPAQSWVIGPFVRPSEAPVIQPNRFYYFTDPITHQKTFWEALHTFNPAATIAPNGDVALVFRAEDASGKDFIGGHTSRLGLATSKDGLFFTVGGAPVLYPANDDQKANEWPGGVEDPRIVVGPDGLYVMTYTQWARDRGRYTVGIATSKNLEDWTKFGPAFAKAGGGQYDKLNYKSAGILTELHNGRLKAVKLHGKYWMYWGEVHIGLATSTDLIHWTPVLDAKNGKPIVVMSARAGHFDSGFPEVGPPPLLTKKGILLIYNGKNSMLGSLNTKNSQVADVVPAATPSPADTPPSDAQLPGDPNIRPGAYSAGEALFSSSDPAKLLGRTDHPILTPIWPYERNGQYTEGTTFAEGLVPFQGQWLLYYGAADSVIGVARADIR
ncbi:MAG: glycoside hydrolase family 130 protein [Acidobacteriaceae bacterium]